MSASHIPNLLSLRGRGGRRGGRGGPTKNEETSPEKAIERQDRIVQATDTDANISRLSAVHTGYLQDSFASDFAPSTIPPGGFTRLPIINRGSYTRTVAIDKLVKGFLAGHSGQQCQIISLGAGSDTRFFRLESDGFLDNCTYHELDFPENTRTKVAVIQKSEKMTGSLGFHDQAGISIDEIHSSNYHLHAIDLRCLDSNHPQYQSHGRLTQIQPDLPTLLISECCLTYLKPETADAVMAYFLTQAIHQSTPKGLVLYEPINPFDSFGKVMVSNLAARGIVLQTLHKYSSLDAQIVRMRTYGLVSGHGAVDLAFLQNHWIAEAEKDRISKLEMLDEVEELNMLMKHYCVVWAWSNGTDPNSWNQWQNIRSQTS